MDGSHSANASPARTPERTMSVATGSGPGRQMRLLTICGSLQQRSANRAALAVVSRVATARGTTIDGFDRLADIPAFNADRDGERIDVIEDWRRRIDEADAVVIAAPEYAGALAGSVKNAFDWLVGSGNMYGKPAGVICAGTSGGHHARRVMAQTLTWQGAYVVADLGISAPRTKCNSDGRFTHPPTVDAISALSEALVEAAAMSPGQLAELARRVLGSLDIDTSHVVPGN